MQVPTLPAHSTLDLSPILEHAGIKLPHDPAASAEAANPPATAIPKGDGCSSKTSGIHVVNEELLEASFTDGAPKLMSDEQPADVNAMDLASTGMGQESQEPYQEATPSAAPQNGACQEAASPPASPEVLHSTLEGTPVPLLMVNPLADNVALLEEQGVSGVQPPEWVWWSKVPAGGTPRPAGSNDDRLTDFARPSPLRYKMQTLDSPGLSNDLIMQVSRQQLMGSKCLTALG